MNRLILAAAIGVGVPVCLGAVALAQPVNPAGAGVPPISTDITRAQVIARVQERFASFDTNGDGVVTKAEFDAYRAKRQADRSAARDAARAQRRDAMFAALDTNKDGMLSKAEFAARLAPGSIDRDGPPPMHDRMGMRGPGPAGDHPTMGGGGMDRGGMGSHMGMWHGLGAVLSGPGADGFFAMLDTNKDGRVTFAEASAVPLAMFDKADTNHDGVVTPEERRAAHAGTQGRWRDRRG